MYYTSRADLDALLKACDAADAADLHLGPSRPPIMRAQGRLQQVPGYPYDLTTADMDLILEFACRSATGPSSVQALDDMDFAYLPAITNDVNQGKLSVYRVNAGMTIEGIRMVFRRLPSEPPTLQQIAAPQPYIDILDSQRQGLILVTGPTGSGKSTTLAAGIRHLIEGDNSLHIITLENPVEYRYTGLNQDAAYVTQRELGRSLKNFTIGMKSALRQDPDIILVGEMRDLETMRMAMEAAETGHLVFGTVHTTDVAATISRIVQMFPTEEQQAARVQLLSSLRFIIAQQLLPKLGGGRVAAREFLEFTPDLRKKLLELNPATLFNELKDATALEGITMMGAVRANYDKGLITPEELRRWELILQEATT